MLSRAEVASSNIRIFGFGATALAIISLCLCPPESWAGNDFFLS
jgi:hypothetical protein